MKFDNGEIIVGDSYHADEDVIIKDYCGRHVPIPRDMIPEICDRLMILYERSNEKVNVWE